MMEIEKSPSGRCHSNTFYRQESSVDTKIRDQKDNEKQNIHVLSKYLTTRYLLITNRKILFGELCRHHLRRMIQVNIISKKTSWHHAPSDMMHWEGHNIISVVSVSKLHELDLIMGKYQIKPIEGQNKWPVLFKSVGMGSWKTKKNWGTVTV